MVGRKLPQIRGATECASEYRDMWNPSKDGGSRIAITEVEGTFFRDLRLGPRMFDLSRHVPRLYEARLRDYRRNSQANVVGVLP